MRVYVSPDFTLTHTHTYTLTTQSDAHIDCLSDCSSGAPAAQIRSERIPSIFTRNFSSVGDVSTAAAFDCCGFLTTASWLLLADNQRGVCQSPPGVGSPGCHPPGLLVVIFARRRRRAAGAQTGGKRKQTHSHTYHSDSGLFCAMTDIRSCFHAT